MKWYKVLGNTPEDWKIEVVKIKNEDCFATLKEAKNFLIEICINEIYLEKQMIKEVKKFKL